MSFAPVSSVPFTRAISARKGPEASVSTQPGDTRFTRTPCGETSFESALL